MNEQYEKRRQRKNHFLKAFILVFIGGYIFFFTSNMWFPSGNKFINATKKNIPQSWEEREVTLLSWNYSKEQQLMEVQLDLKNKSFDGITEYRFSALDRKKGKFKIEPIIQADNFIVLQIKGVNKGWTEISLRINMPNEVKDASTLKLYTNKNQINKVSLIKTKTEKQYMVDRITGNIASYEKQITTWNKDNESLQKQIDNYNEDINKLEESKRYQTEQEMKDTEVLINQAKTNIDTCRKGIDDNYKLIEEYNLRIENSKEEIKAYQ